MSPEMRLRISAQNDTARGFAAVKQDAIGTAAAVEAASVRASGALVRQSGALAGIAENSRQAANQQRNLAYQLLDVSQMLAMGQPPLMTLMQQGPQIAQIYSMEEGGLGRAFSESAKMAAGLAVRLAPLGLAVGGVAAAFSGMQREINKTSDVTVSFGDVANATWQTVADGIHELVKPAVGDMSNWFSSSWSAIETAAYNSVNVQVKGLMVLLAEAELVASGLGDIFKITWQDVANTAIDGFQFLTDSVLSDVNVLRRHLGHTPIELSLGGLKQEGGVGWSEDAFDRFNSRIADIQGNDYAGRFLGSVGERATDLAKVREEANGLANAFSSVGASAVAANDNIFSMTDALRLLGPATVDPLTMLQTQMGDLDKLLAQGKVSWEEYGNAAFRANAGAASAVLSLAGGMTGALSQMFEDNKAFAVANAVVSTSEGIMKALATYGPTPWGFAAAGVAAATGAAQVATIMSASKGKSTTPSVSSAGGGTAAGAVAASTAPARQPQQAVNVYVHGSSFIRGLLDEIAEGINTSDAGDRINIAIRNSTGAR